MEQFKAKEREYYAYRRGIQELEKYVLETVAKHNLVYIEDAETLYAQLKALATQFAPTDEAKEIDVGNEYQRLKKPPKDRDVDKWL